MVDVLAAMAILSSVLFSLLFYQLNQLGLVRDSYYRTIAINQLDNFAAVLAHQNAKSMSDKATQIWNQDNQRLLPDGVGGWSEVASHDCKVSIRWFYRQHCTETLTVPC